ncbi:MAG: N-acetylglucosamine-6-phosphate deacetylase, partial [Carnobacterium sp.]
ALAPERKGSAEFIQYATSKGIKVALAHSDASYEEAKNAVDHGASIFVHTYNGMSPLNHREPGMVGAALTLKGVFNELICDGQHVHPVAAKILMDVRSREEVVLITDCMRAGSMPDGSYTLGEFPVEVKQGAARLKNGSLAGSVLQLKDAIKNVV